MYSALLGEAEGAEDSEQQRRLLAAAKALADATTRMVEAAKGCAGSPEDSTQQEMLRRAAEDVRQATTAATAGALKRQIMRDLERAARYAASASTQCINSAAHASDFNQNAAAHAQLMEQCKYVSDDVMPQLVQSLKMAMRNPDSSSAHGKLIQAAQNLLQPGGRLVTQSKANIPTINDQACAMSLNNAARNLQQALAELRAAAGKAQEASGQLDIESALEQVRALENEMYDHRQAALNGNLHPFPGDDAEAASNQVGAASKTVASAMAQLLTSAVQGNDDYTGMAAKDTAAALTSLARNVRAVAATSNDRQLQDGILDSARDVMDKSATLIGEAKRACENVDDVDNQGRLARVAKAVSVALKRCVDCLPGVREIDDAMQQLNSISQRLANGDFPSTERSFQQASYPSLPLLPSRPFLSLNNITVVLPLITSFHHSQVQIELNDRALHLNQAATDMASASHTNQVPAASNRFSSAYVSFMDTGMEMAGTSSRFANLSFLVHV